MRTVMRAVGVLILAALGLLGGRAAAQPTDIVIQGVLTNAAGARVAFAETGQMSADLYISGFGA